MSEADYHDSAPPPDRDEEREDVELSVETPAEDAAEQHTTLSEADEEARPQWPEHIPFDADPADTADQQHQVERDEDDYR